MSDGQFATRELGPRDKRAVVDLLERVSNHESRLARSFVERFDEFDGWWRAVHHHLDGLADGRKVLPSQPFDVEVVRHLNFDDVALQTVTLRRLEPHLELLRADRLLDLSEDVVPENRQFIRC